MIYIRNRATWKKKGVYIGRSPPDPSVLGNPFTTRIDDGKERKKVITKYREWLEMLPADSPQWLEIRRLRRLYDERGELNLVCHCAPKACHGEIVKMAILGEIKPGRTKQTKLL